MASSGTVQPDRAYPTPLETEVPQSSNTIPSASTIYALLLTPPLDTPEKVQEVTDLPAPPPIIAPENLADDKEATSDEDGDNQAHDFSNRTNPPTIHPTGTYVLLPTPASRDALLAWAARHRAIYTPTILPVPSKRPGRASKIGTTTADSESKPYSFLCWYFFPKPLANPATLSRILRIPEPELRLRHARVKGRKTKHGDPHDAAVVPIATATSSSAPQQSTKLRPAQDILHRLRWDPAFSTTSNPNPNPNPSTITTNNHEDHYNIIYLDRFAGEMSLPLSQWTREISADEFIPLHRILRFERASDGMVLWDREGRVDRVFGSGVSTRVDEAVGGGEDAGKVEVGEEEQGVAWEVRTAEEGERVLAWSDEMGGREVVECLIELLDGEGGEEMRDATGAADPAEPPAREVVAARMFRFVENPESLQ